MNKKFLFVFFAFCLLPSAFCLSQGTWVQKTSLPGTVRLTAVAFTINNKGYLGIGSVGFGSSVSDFWEYDPSTNAWTQKANFGGGPRGFACGFSIGTKGYIGTGLNNTTYYNDFWEYDPSTNVWTQKANVGTTLRWCAVAFAVNGKGYIGMGNNQSYVAQQDVWEYDPVSNTWTAKANYIGVRCDVDRATFTIGNKAYIGTGGNIGTTPSLNYNDFWQYDPSVNSWTQMANFPGNRRYGATGFSVCGEGYLGLGEDSAYVFYNDFYEYDPGTNSWSPAAAFTNPRCDAASFVVGSKAYVCSGSFGTSPFVMYKDLWEFTPSGLTTLSVTATNTVICSGTSVTLTASGGSAYSWSTGSTTTTIVISPTTSSTYTVTDPGNPCSVAGTVTVSVILQPPVSISGNSTVCSGNSATLTASGGGNYSWTTGATNSFVVVAPTITTTYSVIASAATCADTSAFTVSVAQTPVAIVACVDSICFGQSATLSASGGGNYSWNTGVSSSSIIVSPSATTSYSVVVSAGNCYDTANCSVMVNPPPIAGAGADITISYGATTTLTASGGGTYSWSNGTSGAVITVSPAATTNYCVIVVNASGCADTSCVTVFVKPIEPVDCSFSSADEFLIPNAFSPNGDNENDVLKLFFKNISCITEYEFVIYNRWGEKVFKTGIPADEWDGTYNGNAEGSAVFVYYMKATLLSGDEVIKKGNISLIR